MKLFTLATLAAGVAASGIEFSRTIDTIADDSDLSLKFDSGCSSTDGECS